MGVPGTRDAEERLELRLPVSSESVPIGRRAAAQFAEELDSDQTLLWRVRLAVSEAITNVVLHAHAAEECSSAHLTLTASATAERLVVVVSDSGTGMRAREDSPGLGLGLGLISRASDELDVSVGPDGCGTAVRMVFLR